MKKATFKTSLVLAIGTLAFLPPMLMAQTDVAPPPAPETSAQKVKLPNGVEDVLKLSRAEVGEDIIVNYIRNSGTVYNLTANDIVYLRSQGVSERAIMAMLDSKKKLTSQPVPAPTPAPVPAPAPAPASGTVPAPETVAPQPQTGTSVQTTQPPQAAPVYTQPPAVAVEPAPSTVYVAPPPPPTVYYYDPYYYGYYAPYRVYGPSISLGFRFGGGYHGGHYWHH